MARQLCCRSWHVFKICVAIWWPATTELQQCEVSIEFELRAKNRQWNEPRGNVVVKANKLVRPKMIYVHEYERVCMCVRVLCVVLCVRICSRFALAQISDFFCKRPVEDSNTFLHLHFSFWNPWASFYCWEIIILNEKIRYKNDRKTGKWVMLVDAKQMEWHYVWRSTYAGANLCKIISQWYGICDAPKPRMT